MTSWRTWVLIIAGAVLMWWLHPRPGSEHDTDGTEVTIWFNDVIDGRHVDVVDAFEREFPEYKAILGSSASRSGLEGEGNPQRLMCGIAGGVPPEVVEYDRFAICQWAARGAFLDLMPLIKKDEELLADLRKQLQVLVDSGKTDSEETEVLKDRIARVEKYQVKRSDYYAATWDECSYKGGHYGIPNYMDDRVLYYSDDLLVQAGFVNGEGTPVPPDTWEQLLTKKVDVSDAEINGFQITSAEADFIACGVRPGDVVARVSRSSVTRCLVEKVVGTHEIIVCSAYSHKALRLREGPENHIKVFDQDSYAMRLSRWDEEGRLKVVGFEPMHGNGWLFHYGWLNGGKFMSDDRRTCTLNDPAIVEALQFTTDIYDAMGGVAEVNAFKKSTQNAAQDPFFLNQIAMFIQGDWFLRELARYKRDMRFGTHSPPIPQARRDAGFDSLTWVGGFAYCIPATCPEKKLEAAWWMVKYLASPVGGMVMNDHDAQRERGQGRVYMPRLKANKRLNQLQISTYVDVPAMPETIRAGLRTHIALLPTAKYRPVSPYGQKLWNGQADSQDLAWNHGATPKQALDLNTNKVQRAIDKFLAPPAGPEMPWKYVVWAYAGLVALVAGICYWRFKVNNPITGYSGKQWWVGIVFASPWMLGFLILAGGPMVFSLVMSATNYDVISPAVYVGVDNYREMYTVDWDNVGGVKQALSNTVFMAIGLPIGMAAGLALAMLLNVQVKGMSFYRTTFFLPAIMPVVAASVLWIWVFNAHNGLMNWLLQMTGIESLLEFLGVKTPISWLTDKHTSKPALIIMGLWGAGASMIIWLAGLKEIPKHLYEAAALDGASVVRRFFIITLPLLSPYILFNLVMGLIGTFQIFTQAYIMTPNGSPERSTYFYVYKLFDECFSYFRLGYGAAMAWVLFLIVIVLTIVNMVASKRWVHYAGD